MTTIALNDERPKRRKTNEEKTGYGLSSFGLLVAFLTIYFQFCTTLDTTIRLTILSIGIGLIGVGFTLVAKGIAETSWKISSDSDKRMAAMANLEFHEKIAVVEAYISDIYIGRSEAGKALEAHAARIYHDIKGAKELNRYVDPEIKNQLDEEIKKLKNIAEQEQEKYKKLIEKLKDLQKENKNGK